MKKLVLLSLLSLLALTSCSNVTQVSNAKLCFSEFLKGNDAYDRAIEIYNLSDEEVNLGDYQIWIYKNNQTKPYIRIPLSGKLAANETYVVAHSDAKSEIKEKANLLTEDLMVDGSWPVSLNYKKNNIDVLGIIGYQYDYATYCDLVRKKEAEHLKPKTTYDAYDWLRYDKNGTEFLGSIDTVLSDEKLYDGPKLTSHDFALPLINGNVGGGGVVEVDLTSLGDGDTTTFRFPRGLGEISGNNSVRYLGIDTPEIQHGHQISAQPWGYAAKDYNNNVLRGASHYLIQTYRDIPYTENFGRFLGLVWYSNVSNPKPEDYSLLNYEMVRESYAFQFWYSASSGAMKSNSLPYEDYFRNAELKAKKEGKRIHGEIDPDFHY